MKKILLFVLVITLVSCNKDLLDSENQQDAVVAKELRSNILDFDYVTMSLSRLGFVNERIDNEIQDFLPISYDTASFYVNYDEMVKYLIVGFDNKNKYLKQAHNDCDRTFSLRTERDGTVIFVRCEGSGNTCGIKEAENGGLIIVLCGLSR